MAEPRSDVLGTRDGRHNGGSAQLRPGSDWKSLLKADGSEISPDIFTLTWSVAEVPFDQNVAGTFELQGQLRWGTGASLHVVQFDLGRCGNISLVGSSVDFSARNIATVSPTWNVQASLAYGTRASGAASIVSLTVPFDMPDASVGVIRQLPNFARRYIVQPTNESVIGTMYVEELTLNNAVLRTWLPQDATFRTLGNDVVRVRVKGPAAPMAGVIIFELCI